MFNCCGADAKSVRDQFDCKITETTKGVSVDLSPKDASKTESFKAMINGCKDFCDCDC